MVGGARETGAALLIALSGCFSGAPGEEGASGDFPLAGDSAGGGSGDDGGVAELCSEPSVGVSPVLRLTRAQYDNTIRDLLGITSNPSASLSSDEKIGTFYNNGVVPVTELQAEQYMRVAEELAQQAVADLPLLVPCDPTLADQAEQAACGAAFVTDFGLRAFRRPLSADEQRTLQSLFDFGHSTEGFSGGIELVIQAVLQSPQFLYHVEVGVEVGLPDSEGEDVVPLGSYELASRLSYFLWDSMPDDTLLFAAASGELDSPEGLRAQAERMLEDARATAAIVSFHAQWLKLDELHALEKNTAVYPAFDEGLRTAMAQETARFVDYVIRFDDGSLQTLLTASYSFLDGPLFDLYGVERPVDHDPNEPVDLDPSERGGILTHAGVLATHAHADQSSPVRRGKLIRENLLCQILAPPPPNVDVVPPEVDPNASTRERFDQHRSDPSCAGCHVLIDPLGFGFEHYDGVGAFRTEDGNKPVDASGELVSTADIDGTFDGVLELADRLASSEQVSMCVVQQWFNYGLGRLPSDADSCSFDAIVEDFADSGQDIRELLIAIVATDAFRYRRSDGGAS